MAVTTWTTGVAITTASTNPNYEQFSNRTAPFAGTLTGARTAVITVAQLIGGTGLRWRYNSPEQLRGASHDAMP